MRSTSISACYSIPAARICSNTGIGSCDAYDTQLIAAGMQTGKAQEVRVGCEQFLQSLSRFYQVSPCGVRVLASRPLRIRENWSNELFGDYNPSTLAIRVWMRTAVKKDITSFG